MLVARGLQWGMVGFETDFTGIKSCCVWGALLSVWVLYIRSIVRSLADFQFMAFNNAQSTPGVYEEWLGGMNTALAEAGVPLQLCMGLPNDALLSVQVPAFSIF